MTIKTRFDIGDDVFTIMKAPIVVLSKCNACKGSGDVLLDDYEFYPCPKCEGSGDIKSTISSDTWVPRPICSISEYEATHLDVQRNEDNYRSKVQKIYINIHEDNGAHVAAVSYVFHGDYHGHECADCFKTLQDAIVICKLRNDFIRQEKAKKDAAVEEAS